MNVYRNFCLSVLTAAAAQAGEHVVYDVRSHNTTEAFALVLDDVLSAQGRPHFEATPRGLVATPGRDHFTAWRFADVAALEAWTLDVVFRVPEGVHYSNAGVYLLYSNPHVEVSRLPDHERPAFEAALDGARSRKAQLGQGPFELDFFGREVQIVSGERAEILPNFRSGAIYGAPVGEGHERQTLFNAFEPRPGGLYRLVIQFRSGLVETFFEDIGARTGPLPVSRFRGVERSRSPVLGGLPIALLLQAYRSDGERERSPEFQSIRLTFPDSF